MNKISLIIGVLLLMSLCAGCVDKGHVEKQVSMQEEEITIIYVQPMPGFTVDMRVFHDNKRNVTCWRLGNGMSCIPDHLLAQPPL